jgi:hypothetical protein
MRAATSRTIPVRVPEKFNGPEPVSVTLLELVGAVSDVTEDDQEVVATVLHMLRSGRARLCGNFRGADPEEIA